MKDFKQLDLGDYFEEYKDFLDWQLKVICNSMMLPNEMFVVSAKNVVRVMNVGKIKNSSSKGEE